MISRYNKQVALEIQQRSVEFSKLLIDPSLERYRAGILEHVPVPPPPTPAKLTGNTTSPVSTTNVVEPMNDLLALGSSPTKKASDLLGSLSVGVPVGVATSGSGVDVLAEIFGSASKPTAPKNKDDIMGLFGPAIVAKPPTVVASGDLDVLGGANQQKFSVTPVIPASSSSLPGSSIVVYSKNGLVIEFSPSKEKASDPNASICNITVLFRNSNPISISDLNLQVAVPKTLKLQLYPPQSNSLPPADGQTKQSIKILNPVANSLEGKGVALRLRLKITYRLGEKLNEEVVEFNGFPSWSW